VAGATVSVLGGAPDGKSWALAPPEVAGMGLVLRTGFPFVLATGGTLPVLAARAAANAGEAPVPAAALAGVVVAGVFAAVASYVRSRDRLLAAWRQATENVNGRSSSRTPSATPSDEGDEDDEPGADTDPTDGADGRARRAGRPRPEEPTRA
jgi:hypothetical protein